MGLLKSVSFNTECDLNIWNLFKKANELGTRLDYTLEIIDAAMHGRIDVDEEFELDKYIGRIEHTRRLEGVRAAKRVVHFTEDSEDSEDENVSGVAYPVDNRNDFEFLESKYDLQWAVSRFNDMQGYFLVNSCCDVKYTVYMALRGIPDAIDMVKNLCEEYPVAADLLKIILDSNYSYEEIFPNIGK